MAGSNPVTVSRCSPANGAERQLCTTKRGRAVLLRRPRAPADNYFFDANVPFSRRVRDEFRWPEDGIVFAGGDAPRR